LADWSIETSHPIYSLALVSSSSFLSSQPLVSSVQTVCEVSVSVSLSIWICICISSVLPFMLSWLFLFLLLFLFLFLVRSISLHLPVCLFHAFSLVSVRCGRRGRQTKKKQDAAKTTAGEEADRAKGTKKPNKQIRSKNKLTPIQSKLACTSPCTNVKIR